MAMLPAGSSSSAASRGGWEAPARSNLLPDGGAASFGRPPRRGNCFVCQRRPPASDTPK